MSKSKYSEPEAPQIPPQQGILLLKGQIKKAEELLKSRPIEENEYSNWELLTKNYLEKAFGRNSPNISAVTSIGKYGSFPMNPSEMWLENHRYESLQSKNSKLYGLIELLETEISLLGTQIREEQKELIDHRKVFIVHGHDEGALHHTARFIEKVKLEPVILREQPNRGNTIIEKFTEYSNVGFAVVLLTPDDKGGANAESVEAYRSRARQNVILELGFFLGKLGRNRVCALYVSGVEIPSDYQGVIFIQMDDTEGWKLLLAKEIKAAGIEIDMNKVL